MPDDDESEMLAAHIEQERRSARAAASEDDTWRYLDELPSWMIPGSNSIRRTAVISEDGVYRYLLTREWAPGTRCLFIMLNPSTADGLVDDPTINRCTNYARAWGHGALDVVNLFALRSTDPGQLYVHGAPVGPENDEHIRRAVREAACILVAWGTHGGLAQRDRAVYELLRTYATVRPMCLGLTKAGHPKHPLYLRADTQPIEIVLPIGL